MSTYATVDEFKQDIGDIKTVDPAAISSIQRALDAAENAINQAMNRPDGFVAPDTYSYRYYAGDGEAEVLIDECVDIGEVAIWDGDSWDTMASPSSPMAGDGDWMPYPYNAPARSLPYTRVKIDPNGSYSVFPSRSDLPSVRVSSRWGFSETVPALIKTVCIMQAGRWYNQEKGGMADTVASPEMGQLMYAKRLQAEFVSILKDAGYWRPPI